MIPSKENKYRLISITTKRKNLRGVLVQQFAELPKRVWKDNLQNSQKSKTTICIQFVRRICKLSGMTVCKILFSMVIGDYMNFVPSFNLQNWQKKSSRTNGKIVMQKNYLTNLPEKRNNRLGNNDPKQ